MRPLVSRSGAWWEGEGSLRWEWTMRQDERGTAEDGKGCEGKTAAEVRTPVLLLEEGHL